MKSFTHGALTFCLLAFATLPTPSHARQYDDPYLEIDLLEPGKTIPGLDYGELIPTSYPKIKDKDSELDYEEEEDDEAVDGVFADSTRR